MVAKLIEVNATIFKNHVVVFFLTKRVAETRKVRFMTKSKVQINISDQSLTTCCEYKINVVLIKTRYSNHKGAKFDTKTHSVTKIVHAKNKS